MENSNIATPVNDEQLPWQTFVRNKKAILVTAIATGILSLIVTAPVFIKPKYKSETIVYPPGTNSAKIFIERDPRFGSDKEIDEHIQIFQSARLRDSLIAKYNLVTHYDVDTSGATKYYDLYKMYNDNVIIDRTKYNSIVVTVFDTDPIVAAAIANDVIAIGDKVKSEIIHANLMQIFYSIEKEYKQKAATMDNMADKVNAVTQSVIAEGAKVATYNNIDYLRQQSNIQSYIKVATEERKTSVAKMLQDYLNLMEGYFYLQQSYLQAFTNANSAVPACYIVSKAEPSYKKASPQRLLIAMAAALAASVLAWLLYIVRAKSDTM